MCASSCSSDRFSKLLAVVCGWPSRKTFLKRRFRKPMVLYSAQVGGRFNVEANLARKTAPGRRHQARGDGIHSRRTLSVGSCRVAKDWRTTKPDGTAGLCRNARRATPTTVTLE